MNPFLLFFVYSVLNVLRDEDRELIRKEKRNGE